MGAEEGAGVRHIGGVVWWRRVGSAFRTAIACTIAGCMALYGPEPIRQQLRYPSVSYLTAILIVSDATLGDTLSGCWYTFCATMLVWPPSVFCLWAIGPARFSEAGAALAVAGSAFFVALPKSLPLLAKRIAFVQLVIIYVGMVIHGPLTGTIAHPSHVAANTAVGALASILALLLPYPWLAINEVKKLFKLYTENASERASLYTKAFFSEDNESAEELIFQAKPLAESGAKLLHHINLIQEAVKWERPRIRNLTNNFVNEADRVDGIETPVRGMEMALTAIRFFPLRIINSDIINSELRSVMESERVQQTLKHRAPLDDDAMTVPERKEKLFDNSLRALATISPTKEDLPAFFFLSCVELLQANSSTTEKETLLPNNQKASIGEGSEARFGFKRVKLSPSNKECLVFAIKCSLSLGLAVFLGMMFNKENGYWSGLSIAISFATGRLPIFTVANARVQGTAIGSVYGVIGSRLLQRVAETRFIILLPWIIFTSLIWHSQMYGQAGGISAVIGALLILGRKNFGPRNEFAIARLTEASIGLLCFVMVELLLQPARAATLAKEQLSQCLGTLDTCIQQLALCSSCQKENRASVFLSLKENNTKLKSHIEKLKILSKNAESEPDFWFVPFRASCYDKLQETLSRMADLLQFMVYSMDFLLGEPQKSSTAWNELQHYLNSDLELLKENVSPCIKRLGKVTLIKSVDAFELQMKDGRVFQDLESGKPQISKVTGVSADTVATALDNFLQHSKEVTGKIQTTEDEEDFKGQTILQLNSLGFCISSLMLESIQVEKGIKEMLQWENPSRQVDFHKLSCKIDTVYPK